MNKNIVLLEVCNFLEKHVKNLAKIIMVIKLKTKQNKQHSQVPMIKLQMIT